MANEGVGSGQGAKGQADPKAGGGKREEPRGGEQRSRETRGEEQQQRGRGGELSRWFGPSGFDPFRTSPFSMMRRVLEDFDRMFEELSPVRQGGGEAERGISRWRGAFHPQVEIVEREGALTVRADLPGVDRKDLKVEVVEDAIMLQGERRQEREEERSGVYRSERSYGSFRRVIPLPAGADPDNARAHFADGVLEITVPIEEEKSHGRRIEIQEGKPTPGLH